MFRRHGAAYREDHRGHLGRIETKVMGAVEACRTAILGGHLEQSADCGLLRPAYNAASVQRNRTMTSQRTALAAGFALVFASAALAQPTLGGPSSQEHGPGAPPAPCIDGTKGANCKTCWIEPWLCHRPPPPPPPSPFHCKKRPPRPVVPEPPSDSGWLPDGNGGGIY